MRPNNQPTPYHLAIISCCLLFALPNPSNAAKKTKPTTSKKCAAILEPSNLVAQQKTPGQLPYSLNDEYFEATILDQPYSQFPSTSSIKEPQIISSTKITDENGEALRIEIRQLGNEPTEPCDQACLDVAKRRQLIVQSMQPTQSVSPLVPTTGNDKPLTSTVPSDYSHSQLIEMIRRYTAKQRATTDTPFSEEALSLISSTMVNDEKYVKEMLADYNKLMASTSVILTNTGKERYFWFKPDGTEGYRPARILDIHLLHGKYSLLAEWLIPEQNTNSRVRFVTNLSHSEIPTIHVDTGDFSRKSAAADFAMSLSPNELLSLKLAKRLRIHTFGYTSVWRQHPVMYENRADPLSTMSNISHLAILSFAREFFPTFRKYLTLEEKEIEDSKGDKGYINIIDVFSRIPVKTFFNQIAAPNPGFEYFWLITEDGQLKVSPHLKTGNNLKYQLLRLAHGRRIFAGGGLRFDERGQIHLDLDSNGFQDVDNAWGSSGSSFQTASNGNLHPFILSAFESQAGQTVTTIGTNPTSQYYTKEADTEYFGSDYFRQRGEPASGTQEDDDLFSWLKDTLMNKKKKSGTTAEQPKWDPKSKTPPMNFVEWAKSSGKSITDPSSTTHWAHYVLSTDSNMTMRVIKKKYKRYAQTFHPDKNKTDEHAEEIFKTVKQAYETLKGLTK